MVYTSAARTAAGGETQIAALVDEAVAYTNAAFARSLIQTQVNLVHLREVDYEETGQWQVDGPRLAEPADGHLDEVHPLRDEYGADCVSLVVNSLDSGGIGYFPHPSLEGIGAGGFNILRLDNLPGILAHELGHNLFCAHDRAHAPDPPFAEYSYGYVEPGGAWQTIMAVAPSAAYIPYYANPEVLWPGPDPPNPGPTGVPVGEPEPCDIALTINQTRLFVANFRASRVFGLPPVLHVRSDAPPEGDGSNWANALGNLADALCAAARSNGDVREIWVAAGTYTPDRGSLDRTSTFRLVNGVTVYGGFSGDETDLAERDPSANPTVLSGDIGAPGTDSDNCYHVLTLSLTDTSAVLDGFTITGGYADGSAPDDSGGAVFAHDGGAASLRRCTITGNAAAQHGGGVYCDSGSSPQFDDCLFADNSALLGGGLAALYDCHPTLTGCAFTGHAGSIDSGGAIYLYGGCNPVLERCTFAGNTANYGGAMAALFDCLPELTNCVIRANTAINGGGGLYLYAGCAGVLTNCLFSGNNAQGGGGLSLLFDSDAVLTNCTLVGNSALFTGGGIDGYQTAAALTNNILWSNEAGGQTAEAGQIGGFDGALSINYCTVQGWTGGLGGTANNGDNPMFIDADGPDDLFGTLDDNPRLQPASPCIDSGDNDAVPPAVTADLDGRMRIINGTVDRGTYEFAIPGDGDGDGNVDLDDWLELANCLAGPGRPPNPTVPPTPTECLLAFDKDGDSDVDLHDAAAFTVTFGAE